MKNQLAKNILIVEDDFLVSKNIESILKAKGYNIVDIAPNGEKGISLTLHHRPDVVLMDINLPELDGLEATRQIQASCPTPVIILTGYESNDLIHKASEYGASAFLTKPPSGEEIDRTIIFAMARHLDLMKINRLNKELESEKAALQKALEENKILRGILPVCSCCNNVRTNENSWERIDSYIQNNTNALISHGICPDCKKKYYSNIFDNQS